MKMFLLLPHFLSPLSPLWASRRHSPLP